MGLEHMTLNELCRLSQPGTCLNPYFFIYMMVFYILNLISLNLVFSKCFQNAIQGLGGFSRYIHIS